MQKEELWTVPIRTVFWIFSQLFYYTSNFITGHVKNLKPPNCNSGKEWYGSASGFAKQTTISLTDFVCSSCFS